MHNFADTSNLPERLSEQDLQINDLVQRPNVAQSAILIPETLFVRSRRRRRLNV